MPLLTTPQLHGLAPRSTLRSAKPQPAYAVVLHDDALNAIDHAARTLAHTLGILPGAAWGLARQVDRQGNAVVWVGHAAAAHAIARTLTAAGPDPIMSAFGAGPLDVEVVALG